METNEIMENEEVVATTGKLAKACSKKSLKAVAGTGLVVLVGIVAYKFGVEPAIAKAKAKKELRLYTKNESGETNRIEEGDMENG